MYLSHGAYVPPLPLERTQFSFIPIHDRLIPLPVQDDTTGFDVNDAHAAKAEGATTSIWM